MKQSLSTVGNRRAAHLDDALSRKTVRLVSGLDLAAMIPLTARFDARVGSGR